MSRAHEPPLLRGEIEVRVRAARDVEGLLQEVTIALRPNPHPLAGTLSGGGGIHWASSPASDDRTFIGMTTTIVTLSKRRSPTCTTREIRQQFRGKHATPSSRKHITHNIIATCISCMHHHVRIHIHEHHMDEASKIDMTNTSFPPRSPGKNRKRAASGNSRRNHFQKNFRYHNIE
jgi:hypothetical protein